jgi:periplasmic protein TonB
MSCLRYIHQKQNEGTVKLHAIVASNGSVKELTVLSGEPILAESAMAAVKQWRYKPTLIDNEPAEVDTVVVVIFEMVSKHPLHCAEE